MNILRSLAAAGSRAARAGQYLHDLDTRRRGAILNNAAREVKPMVRAAVLANLAASGIKRRSGRLAAAIRGLGVWVTGGNLTWAFTGDEPENVIRYGSALNYGWIVRPRALVGKGLARKLRRRIRRGTISAGAAERSGFRAIPGREFFTLTAAQLTPIMAAFRAAVMAQIRGA